MVAHRKQGLRERHVNHVLLVHSCGEEKEIQEVESAQNMEPTATPIFVLEAPSERLHLAFCSHHHVSSSHRRLQAACVVAGPRAGGLDLRFGIT